MLKRFSVSHFRNYASLEFNPSSGLNIVYGSNGSGKTSLLEAIYTLSSGRSFRTHLAQKLIQHPQAAFVLYAELLVDGAVVNLGMKRGQQGIEALRRNNLPVKAISDIAKGFPVQVFHPQSIELVVGETSLRRSWLDWGLFHVEQDYGSLMRQYKLVLKQRNSLLRNSRRDKLREISVWDQQLTALSDRIDLLRKGYLKQIAPYFKRAIDQLLPSLGLTFDYYRGWNQESDFAVLLKDKLETDSENGYTSIGPHRADIRFKTNLGVAKDTLSRGQSKLLSYSLLLCQLYFLVESRGLTCLVLVDDLASELDACHQKLLLDALVSTGQQMIVTALDHEELPTLKELNPAVFHVEHGHIHLSK